MAIQTALAQRHRDGVRRVPAVGRAARRDRGGDGAHDPLGARRAWRRRRRRASSASASCRAASTSICGARTWPRSRRCRFDGLALGGLGVGEAPEVMYGVIDAVARRDAGGPPALPDGRRHARGHLDGDRRRRRHVRLRDADAQRAQRPAVRPRRRASTSPTRSTATIRTPVEDGCPCECCASYSRGYLAHLFRAEELLYHRLASIHNLAALPEPGAPGAGGDPRRGISRVAVVGRTRMAKRVGVLLSGCGRLDGSDVAETMLTLLVIERAGAPGDLRRARRRAAAASSIT